MNLSALAADNSVAQRKARQEFAALFDKRDFAALDALVGASIAERRVLVDGELHLTAMMDLGFSEGGVVDPEARSKGKQSLLAQVHAWQRAKPASTAAPLAEALMWHAWAYNLRGRGTDDQSLHVQKANPLALRYFQQYSGKAHKALLAHKAVASANPVWYELMLNLQADIDKPVAESEAVYREGIARFPWYYPIHEAMIYRLIRTRQNTGDKVAQFINEATHKDGDRLYARLWRVFDDLEPHHGNLFRDAPVSWPRMRKGLLEGLKVPVPASVNDLERVRYGTLASFACRAGDWATYRLAHPNNNVVYIAVGDWRNNYSEDVCNRMANAALPTM